MKLIRTVKSTLLVLLVSIALLEVVGSILGNNDYFWENRHLFVSKSGFRAIGESGLWTYSPHTKVRYSAVYHLSQLDDWIEYRCEFETNRFGLIETNFNDSETSVDFLVLGGSFTEGHGGCPWLTKDEIPENFPVLVNGGLQGGGIQSFELLEKWLSERLMIKNVVVIAISNNFKRSPSNWVGWTQKCISKGNCDPNSTWQGINKNLSDEDLIKLSREKYALRNESKAVQLRNMLRYYSTTYRILKKYISMFETVLEAKVDAKSDQATRAVFSPNFDALQRLKSKYPALKLVLVPQRDEVGFLGEENYDTKVVKNYLRESGIAYTYCHLKISDYMPIDGHPNAGGYAKLSACLRSSIL